MKDYQYDRSVRELAEKEKADLEEQELQERRRAVNVLMNHGITQAKGLSVSRRAAFERKFSN